MTTYRALFAVREFRVLFVVRLFAMTAVVVSGLALGTVMYDETGSPFLTAVSLFGGPLVQLLSARYLLASSDLLRPRTAMVFMACVALAMASLQMIPGLTWWARFLILAGGYVALSATSGAVIALLSDIVPKQSFILARATLNITVGGMQIIGYGIGAVLLAAASTTWLFRIAALVSIVAGGTARLGLPDLPARASGKVVARSRAVNRELLTSPSLRPLFLMMWVPNGLVVGCEALFIPYATDRAGYLFAAGAVGMLAGDVIVGRFVPEHRRDRLILPMRLLLAVPFLVFPLSPPVPLAAVLVGLSAFGYSASLPLQERLVHATRDDVRGQAFGLSTTGLQVGQAIGALVAGALAEALAGMRGVGLAMAAMAVMSLLVVAALVDGLRRSQPAEVLAA
ncbi:MFS transporter [Micromonospora sp. ALFpr18c]|uniref:MFS transporter n=1 Tax=unclassified Micromonospora TaxID=2617518 RepID=UPI00124B14E8|nr:MFS transporter [Micromonospora sp. ALFpr18c]KAB1931834.1 MFS transporter [Micromonospora sp. ALFpr18c]